jgi:hypothetical protein
MITSLEKATQNLQRKIRKVGSNALPGLLGVGTGGRSAAGRLDGMIDALETRLCKALTRGYPKIVAAAIIEKRRSTPAKFTASITEDRTQKRIPVQEQEPGISAVGKTLSETASPDSLVTADLEQPIPFLKEGPITDERFAAKSRKKAIKARRKAEQAAASAADAREQLNKGAEMDAMIAIAKSVIVGKPTTYTKRDFFVELQKRADEYRQPNETRERAFARYATTEPNGRVLMQAHKAASGEDFTGEPDEDDDEPTTNEAFRRLMDLATEKRELGETVEQAFARLYSDPKYRDHRKAHARCPGRQGYGDRLKRRCVGRYSGDSTTAEVRAVKQRRPTGRLRSRFFEMPRRHSPRGWARAAARTQG